MTESMTETMTESMTKIRECTFETLGLPIPLGVPEYPSEIQKEIFDYLEQMNKMERKAYIIAQQHLGTSFNIYRSNGFKEWRSKKGITG